MRRTSKKMTVILTVLLLIAVMAPSTGAYSSACEDFANSAGVGTTGGLWNAIQCATSNAADFLEITGRWWDL